MNRYAYKITTRDETVGRLFMIREIENDLTNLAFLACVLKLIMCTDLKTGGQTF